MKKSIILKAAREYYKTREEGNANRTDWKPDALEKMYAVMKAEGLTKCFSMGGSFFGVKTNEKSTKLFSVHIGECDITMYLNEDVSDYIGLSMKGKSVGKSYPLSLTRQ